MKFVDSLLIIGLALAFAIVFSSCPAKAQSLPRPPQAPPVKSYPEPNPKLQNCGCAVGLPCDCANCTCAGCTCGECAGKAKQPPQGVVPLTGLWEAYGNGWLKHRSTGVWKSAEGVEHPADYWQADGHTVNAKYQQPATQPHYFQAPLLQMPVFGGGCAGGG